MRRLIFDTSNLLFRVSAANSKYNDGTPEEKASLALHMSLNIMKKFVNTYKPGQIAVTFEGGDNWRKSYTKSADCKSKRVYKANRVKDDSMAPFFELVAAFEELAKSYTSLICLSHPQLEGDDLFAGYVQRFAQQGDEVIGVSGDKDFVQLLKYPNFKLINPDTAQPRSVVDACGVDDPLYFMFEKAFRGDRGDNVFPAYPRVLKKRLQKAFNDDYELTKLLNETWSFTDDETGEKTEYRVGDLFEENVLLMDLEGQPANIRTIIDESIDAALAEHGKFSLFRFSQFCGKHGLKQVAESATQFAPMFSLRPSETEQKLVASNSLLSY